MIEMKNQERMILVGLGLLQGILYYLLFNWFDHNRQMQMASAALIAITTVFVVTVQFSWSGKDPLRLIGTALVKAGLFGIITWWVWSQVPVSKVTYDGDDFRFFTWPLGSLLAFYLLLPYVQIWQKTGRLKFPYSDLYRHSWNNFFIAGIGLLVAGLYWILVELCAGLFHAVGVTVVGEIIHKRAFVMITLSAMFGLGVAMGKEGDRIINTLRMIAGAIFRGLFPLLVLIILAFLLALPVTGLKPLWATRSASGILLGLSLLTILFINALFQDGDHVAAYPPWLRRAVQAVLLTMPVVTLLTGYSIGLRINQYGFTPERVYVFIFTIVTGLYGAGYAAALFIKQDAWLGLLRPVNKWMSFLVVALALLTHTAGLDPLKWSAYSQYRLLLKQKVSAAKFDFGALRFKLGHYGNDRLESLAQLQDHPEKKIIVQQLKVLKSLTDYSQWRYPAKEEAKLTFGDFIVMTPFGRLPDGLFEEIVKPYYHLSWPEREECAKEKECVIAVLGSSQVPKNSYALVTGKENDTDFEVSLYGINHNNKWYSMGSTRFGEKGTKIGRDQVIEALRKGEVTGSQPFFQCLQINGKSICSNYEND